jgi:hypothetical protein
MRLRLFARVEFSKVQVLRNALLSDGIFVTLTGDCGVADRAQRFASRGAFLSAPVTHISQVGKQK